MCWGHGALENFKPRQLGLTYLQSFLAVPFGLIHSIFQLIIMDVTDVTVGTIKYIYLESYLIVSIFSLLGIMYFF